MKLKWYVVSSNLLLAVLIVVCMILGRQFHYQAFDLPLLNDWNQSIQEELVIDGSEQNKKALCARYGCEIIYTSSKDYHAKLYEAMVDGSVIFDLLLDHELYGKIIFPQKFDNMSDMLKRISHVFLIIVIILAVILNLIYFYLYAAIIHPFQQLQTFAKYIARGEFDRPLKIHKKNYFGAFTESFDLMRDQLKAAKEGELAAQKSKRELVASLSHDIKTPVATIKALCEVLELRLKDESNHTKIVTIEQKADLIDQLISNMFHATLEELEALKIEPTEQPSTILTNMLKEADVYDRIHFLNPLPECLILCDELRLNQVIDNVIMNSYKYADTQIEVSSQEVNDSLVIRIRDFGDGCDESETALLCEKFYRGTNASHQSGSGLGLYLSNQFMNGMGGSLAISIEGGFVVTLSLKKV